MDEKDSEKPKQYDELLSDIEQEELNNIVKWMSIQQTVLLSLLVAASLSTLLICAYRLCKSQTGNVSQEESLSGLVVSGPTGS